MELVELIRGAQDAMDRGDYAHTASACTHALDTYPACFAAHRMLAEAMLEQGRTDAAIEHFDRALTLDPLNVVARLGLGVAAEEKRDVNTAYSAYLNAWETNPALDQVRDELVRLRGLLGGDERLHPTRAGLAGMYARGGQFGRAAAEWRAVLLTEPENPRARTALAEILWRSGDDLAAAAACRDVLHVLPDNARALAMLSEIEQRRGSIAAAELVDRYQAVDPLGEVATLLAEWREGTDVSVLRRESASLPDFDPSAAPQEQVEYAGVASNGPTGAPGLSGGHFAAPDLWDTIIKDLGTDGVDPGVAAPVDNGVQPFSWQDETGINGLPNLEPFSLDSLPGDTASVPADLHDALPPLAPAASAPMSLDDAIAALAPAPVVPAAIAVAAFERSSQTNASDLLLPEVEPFALSLEDVEVAPDLPIAPVMPAAPVVSEKSDDKFVTADGRVDLTAGWDDLDRQLREATPSFDNAAEIDALAAELGVDGVVPFDMGENPFDDSAWAPFTDDDLGAGALAAPIAVPASDPVSAYVAGSASGDREPMPGGWDLDDELVSAIPAQRSTGYTEMLRHVDTELPLEVGSEGEVNPFANPDTSGDPLAFEDLLAVTSRDGTAPLAAPPEMLATTSSSVLGGLDDAVGAAFEASAPIGSDETLIDAFDVPADIDPFTFEDVPAEPIDVSALADANEPEWFVDVAPETRVAAADVPLDENPFALEELLRGDTELSDAGATEFAAPAPDQAFAEDLVSSELPAGWAVETSAPDQTGSLDQADEMVAPVEVAPEIPVLGEVGDDALAASFEELGDLQPFSLDETVPVDAVAEATDVVDFSEINEAPFDPQTLSQMIDPAAQATALPDWAVEAEAEDAATRAVETEAASAWRDEAPFESQELVPAVETVGVASQTVEPAAARETGDGLIVMPGTIAWPAFVNHTSELIDRDHAGGTLFARLRESKRVAVSAGLLTVDRSIQGLRKGDLPVDNGVQVISVPAPDVPALSPKGTGLSESDRIDLMAMRVRLIEDAESAEEVAHVLEGAVSQGMTDPLALRVLGEAYLKLGRTEQAAAQFRQAMLARRRTR